MTYTFPSATLTLVTIRSCESSSLALLKIGSTEEANGSLQLTKYSNCVKVKVAHLCLTLWDSVNYRVHEFSRPEYWKGQPFPSLGHLSNPGIELRSPTLQEDSLSAEAQRKPKNTGVGSLSLLQRVFPTQESNQGLLHYMQILYQLSSQGSPRAQSISVFYEKAKRTTSSMFP